MNDKRLTRSSDDRVVAGVCGGIARYLNVDPLLVRLLFGVLMLGGEGIAIYAVLWLVLPEDTELLVNDANVPRLARPYEGRQIAGVCAGIAEHFRFDVRLVRLLFVLAALSGGTGILLYILLAIIIPDEHEVAVASDTAEKPKRQVA